MNKFVKEGISALPIVDENSRLVGIYSKFDVINLAATKTYTDLEVTLKEATEHKLTHGDGVHSCRGIGGEDITLTGLVNVATCYRR